MKVCLQLLRLVLIIRTSDSEEGSNADSIDVEHETIGEEWKG